MQAGAACLLAVAAYVAYRDGLLSSAAVGGPAPSVPSAAMATPFPPGISLLQPLDASAHSFRALPPPLLTVSFCQS